MITGNVAQISWHVLRLKENPGKNLNQEIDTTGNRTRDRRVKATMLALDHSGGQELYQPSSYFTNKLVHRCGAGGSMRVCHASGPGSIPGRNKFPGWGFFRVFLTYKTNITEL